MTVAGSYQSNQTEAAVNGINLTLDPIEKFVFSGVQAKFIEYFEAPTIWKTTSSEERALNKLFGSERSSGDASTTVPYPYMFLTVSTWAKDLERFNTRSLASRGLTIVPTSDERRAFRVHVLPVTFTVNVKFVTNRTQDVFRFVSRWLFAMHKSHLNFNIVYGKATFSIQVEMDTDVPIPAADADLNSATEYAVETSLRVRGFISDPVLQEQQVATDIVNTLSVVGSTSPLSAPESATVVWTLPPRP